MEINAACPFKVGSHLDLRMEFEIESLDGQEYSVIWKDIYVYSLHPNSKELDQSNNYGKTVCANKAGTIYEFCKQKKSKISTNIGKYDNTCPILLKL